MMIGLPLTRCSANQIRKSLLSVTLVVKKEVTRRERQEEETGNHEVTHQEKRHVVVGVQQDKTRHKALCDIRREEDYARVDRHSRRHKNDLQPHLSCNDETTKRETSLRETKNRGEDVQGRRRRGIILKTALFFSVFLGPYIISILRLSCLCSLK